MSRKVIIIILILLIVGVLGGTAALVMQRFKGATPTTSTPSDAPSLTDADDGSARVVDPNGDDDNDGLPNALEVVWNTDPNNPDTDGDGFTDGEEVAKNHNPTVAGPNDALPSGFAPRQDRQPNQPIQVDQFFTAGTVELFPHNGRNLTSEYNRRYSEAERNEETAVQFAKEQGTVTGLPRVADATIQITQTNNSQTIGHYLDAARGYSSLMDPTTVGEIFIDLFDNNDTSSVLGMAQYVSSFQKDLGSTRVPTEAASLHKLLMGFSEVLTATYIQMSTYNEDPIKALNAIYQLELIDQQYMSLIATEYRRLETAY